MTGLDSAKRLCLLIPVYDDWDAVATLLEHLDRELASTSWSAHVLLVDDGSTRPVPEDLARGKSAAFTRVEVLELRRNLGHQRAIAIGLAHVEENVPCRAVLVMDGDGEDRPSDVPALLARFEESGDARIVFARRARRSESRTFRILYRLYILAHRILTGDWVEIGNFSVLSADHVARLVAVSETWNHYAAAVVKSRLPFETVDTERGHRYSGTSKMNLMALVLHGLSAISVHGEVVGTRLLVATAGLILAAATFLVATVAIRLATDLAIPGWATYATGLLLVILLQAIILAVVFIFVVLAGRQMSSFLPLRDYRYLVRGVKSLHEAE
ncbi:MAG: glycosyltransferase [Myxococcota bacterium]